MAGKDELRKELEAKLAALDQDDDEPEFEYEIGRGDNYARVSSKSPAGKKIRQFFSESFGFDIADEPVQEPDTEPEPKEKPRPGRTQAKGDTVRAFQRRIG